MSRSIAIDSEMSRRTALQGIGALAASMLFPNAPKKTLKVSTEEIENILEHMLSHQQFSRVLPTMFHEKLQTAVTQGGVLDKGSYNYLKHYKEIMLPIRTELADAFIAKIKNMPAEKRHIIANACADFGKEYGMHASEVDNLIHGLNHPDSIWQISPELQTVIDDIPSLKPGKALPEAVKKFASRQDIAAEQDMRGYLRSHAFHVHRLGKPHQFAIQGTNETTTGIPQLMHEIELHHGKDTASFLGSPLPGQHEHNRILVRTKPGSVLEHMLEKRAAQSQQHGFNARNR